MKRINIFAVAATIVALCAAMVSCTNKMGDDDDPIIIVVPDTTTTPDPTPDPSDPENTDWRWSVVGDQTLDFFTDTEIVEAKNIGQLTRLVNNKPETKLDSVILSYKLGVELKAPNRIVVFQKDTTVAEFARTSDNRSYGEYIVSAKDSVCTVSTGHTFPTQYYDIIATTTSKRGASLHAGHWEEFKYITESARWSKIWHESLTEITINDSVFNREIVHNELTFVIKSNKGNIWYVSREKVVIVDHFIKIKEGEKEEKHNHPSWWGEPIKIIGQGTFVYRPGVGPKGQGQFYKNINILFENVLVCVVTKSYVKDDYSPMDFDWDNALVYSLGSTLRGKTITSKNVTDLNSAIWRDSHWEAACCTYDHSKYCWTYTSPDWIPGVIGEQGMTEHLAETCGLKNFAGKHTARLHPSLFYKDSMANGTLTIKDDNGVAFMSFH